MKIAYFDTFSGISGDMAVGACLGAGVPLETLRRELAKLPVRGYRISTRPVSRSMIAAVKFDVETDEAAERHEHAHGGEEGHAHGHRAYRDIAHLIEESALGERVRAGAGKMFRLIAEAEGRIHGIPAGEVEFHEVGAVDSIVDLVGTAICLDLLGIEKVYSSPVKTGSGGTIDTQHGTMPIPTPATLEILKGYPMQLTDIPYELATPTGAAILAALSEGILPPDASIAVEAVGYGAGGRDIPQLPNLLRLVVGTLEERYEREDLATIETNIDDMNPEVYPWLIERLLAAGAHDAYLVPIVMKKGRPGTLLSVMSPAPLVDTLLRLIYRETTTLGVRVQRVQRMKLPRQTRVVETRFGPVRMKAVLVEGRELLRPEYEECKRIAEEFSVPLMDVYRLLEHETRR